MIGQLFLHAYAIRTTIQPFNYKLTHPKFRFYDKEQKALSCQSTSLAEKPPITDIYIFRLHSFLISITAYFILIEILQKVY